MTTPKRPKKPRKTSAKRKTVTADKKVRGPIGAPRKISQENMDEIITALRVGTPPKIAAMSVGVHYSTLNNWLRRGEYEYLKRLGQLPLEPGEEHPPTDPDPNEDEFVNLFVATMPAQAEPALVAISTIYRAIQTDPNHAWQYLVRMFPEQYAKSKQPVKVEVDSRSQVNVTGTQQHTHVVETPDLDRIGEIIAALTGAGAFDQAELPETPPIPESPPSEDE